MLNILLAPVALLYGFGVYIRNLLFDIKILKSVSFNRAVICVGNLTVGGTGKTPHIEYLIKLLSQNHKIATLSRGYKRKTRGYILANEKSNSITLGDEPYQMFSKFPNITVAVDEKRVRGIKRILEDNPDTEIILLDDAFQHRYVKPGYSILLTDYNNLIAKDHFLPLGRLRDSLSQLHRADTVIVTKCPPDMKPIDQRVTTKELNLYPYQNIFFTTFDYAELQPVYNETDSTPKDISSYKCFALAGIANPVPFFNYVKTRVAQCETMALVDHYQYTEKKIRAIFEKFSKLEGEKKLIITTEKDASRLKCLEALPVEIKNCFYYIPIEVKFINGTQNEFNNKIQAYVRKSKRDSILYSE